jgi:hypothetical protein
MASPVALRQPLALRSPSLTNSPSYKPHKRAHSGIPPGQENTQQQIFNSVFKPPLPKTASQQIFKQPLPRHHAETEDDSDRRRRMREYIRGYSFYLDGMDDVAKEQLTRMILRNGAVRSLAFKLINRNSNNSFQTL